VDDYLDFCESQGQEPERPLSGRLLLRMDPDLHRAAAIAADLDESSLNAWICDRIRDGVAGKSHAPRYAKSAN
jgi:predicted HicB family RNase H-like nuclease